MNENFTPPPPDSPTTASHEKTDANPFAIGLFGAFLVLLIAGVQPLLSWVFWRFEAVSKRADRTASASVVAPTFSGPKLQSAPAIAMAELRQNEKQRLSTYGWVDREQGVVRIPVDRAMALLAERGLPEPQQRIKPLQKEGAEP